MDEKKKQDNNSLLKDTVTVAGGAIFLTGYAAVKGTMWAGTQIKKGAQNVYNMTIEDKRKFDAINKINKYAEETKRNLEIAQKNRELKLNKEIKQYNQICVRVKDKLEPAKRYLLYYDEDTATVKIEGHRNINQINTDTHLSGLEITRASLSTGGIAGAAAGGGAAALMTALGTASTGTALSSLSGAAFTHALLASFGGGSLASGGLGMAGGAVVLGSLVTIPALAIAGLVADKQIEKAYTKAKDLEQNIAQVQIDCKELFLKYDSCISSLHKITREFAIYSQLFAQIVDTSVMVASIPRMKADYRLLLNMAITIANNYMNISVINVDGTVNESIEDDLNHLLAETESCNEKYEKFYESMSRQEQALANTLPDTSRDNYDKVIKIFKNKIETLQDELDETKTELQKEKEKFDDYRIHQNKYAKDLEKKLMLISTEKERIEEENKALILKENIQKFQFPAVYEKHKIEIQNKFPKIRNTDVVDFIASGELSYEIFSSVVEGDYSQIVMEYAKATETMLIDVIYFNGWCDSKKTLTALKKMPLNDIENKYIKSPKYQNRWNDDFIYALDIIRNVRNPGAHKCKIDKNKMLLVREIVMGGGRDGINKKGILSYLSDKLKNQTSTSHI